MSELQQKGPDDNGPNAPDSSVVVGVILGSHGTKGELRVRVMSEVPNRFDPGQTLYVGAQPHVIAGSSRGRGNAIILKLQGINTDAAARDLTGMDLTCQADSAPPLPEGEYFHFQLMGLQVFTEEGELLGRISEIIVTGSNDVYLVQGERGEILLPAISQVVQQVDVQAGTMVVRLLDGLR